MSFKLSQRASKLYSKGRKLAKLLNSDLIAFDPGFILRGVGSTTWDIPEDLANAILSITERTNHAHSGQCCQEEEPW